MATLFVRSPNPVWYMVDLLGFSLNDEYYAFFLQNTLPYLPQSVYQDPEHTTPWANPLQFEPGGTLPINLYFDPTSVYRIEIRHGDSQSDELVYEINDYVPEGDSSSNDISGLQTAENMISNPEFAEVNFESSVSSPFIYTQSISDNYILDIAPGWQLFLSGMGTIQLTQLNFPGDGNLDGNPSYALRITNSGDWTTIYLVQRLNRAGAIFSRGSIAMSVYARAQSTPKDVSLFYNASFSSPTDLQTIVDGIAPASQFTTIQGAIDIDTSTNTDLGDAAYVDIGISLEIGGTVDITNVQLVGQSVPLPTDFDSDTDIPLYKEQSIERQIDHLFHYYKDPLVEKPIPSYLVGWDFTFNPCQDLGTTVFPVVLGGPNLSRYIADQTILFTSVDNSIGMAQSFGGFNFSTGIDSSFAIIQYLGNPNSIELLKNKLSVQIQAISGTTIPCEINLYWTADGTLPSLVSPTCQSLVSAVSATGVPTIGHGTWNKVTRSNGLGDASFNVVLSTSQTYPTYSFNGWDDTQNVNITTATYFAIVVSFGTLVAANQVVIDHISLCAGDIATRPAPQTFDQVLRECQYYYEKSYFGSTVPGTVTEDGQLLETQLAITNPVAGTGLGKASSFDIKFKNTKLTAPTVTIYSSLTGASNSADYYFFDGGAQLPNTTVTFSDFWVLHLSSQNSASYWNINDTDVTTGIAGVNVYFRSFIFFQYVADSRLGV